MRSRSRFGGVEHVFRVGADEMLADDLRRYLGRQLAAVVAPLQVARQLARVHLVAVGRHRDDHVVRRAQLQMLGHLDGAEHVGDGGQAEIGERAVHSSGATPSRRAR